MATLTARDLLAFIACGVSGGHGAAGGGVLAAFKASFEDTTGGSKQEHGGSTNVDETGGPADDVEGESGGDDGQDAAALLAAVKDATVRELLELARERQRLERAEALLSLHGSPYQAALAAGIQELLATLTDTLADLEADVLEDPSLTPYHLRYHLRDFVVVVPAVTRVARACCRPAAASGPAAASADSPRAGLRGGALLDALHAHTMTGDAALQSAFSRYGKRVR